MENNNRILVSRQETKPAFESVTELGQVIMDEYKIKTLYNLLHGFFTEKVDAKIKEIIAKRIATYSYHRNINYGSLMILFEKLGIDKNIHHEIYTDYENFHESFALVDLIENPKKQIGLNSRELNKIEQKIYNLLLITNRGSYPCFEIDNKTDVVLLTPEGSVVKAKYKDEDRTQPISEEKVFNCCPVEVEVLLDPEDPLERYFNWKFVEKDKAPFDLNRFTLRETVDTLSSMGLVLQKRNAPDIISASLGALQQYSEHSQFGNEYSERIQIVKKGFGFDKKRNVIMMEDYKLKQFSNKQIKEAFELMLEYINEFKTEKEQQFVIHNLKWGLYSPFIYCSKQIKRIIPYPYLMGMGGSGKSVGHGYPILYMWYDSPEDGTMAGSKMTSRAQFGSVVNESTFPLVIEEGDVLFENPKDIESRVRLKNCIEVLVLRHTRGDKGQVYKTLNPFLVTSNGYITDSSDAVTRRLDTQLFTFKERKTDADSQAFLKKYKIGASDCVLDKFKAISHTFAQYMLDNPNKIYSSWKDVVNNWLCLMFNELKIEMPPKLLKWNEKTDGVEVQVQLAEETIKQGIQELINRERKNTLVYLEGETKNANEMSDEYHYVKAVLINHRLAGLEYKNTGDNDFVFITQSFIDKLFNLGYLENRLELKSFAENYNWEYENRTKYINGNYYKACFLSYEDFIRWCYDKYI